MSLGAADTQYPVSAERVTVQQLDDPRLWSVAARLMTPYAKTFPGSDGAKAVHWYRKAADPSDGVDTRVWVRGRAAIAVGDEGAVLPIANVFADQAIALSDRPSLGVLNAVFGRPGRSRRPRPPATCPVHQGRGTRPLGAGRRHQW
ncbi:hypothetical protein ACFV60_11920 [Streptomyces virginiae]|uniref:hypothetical protein n=1 Tax=Streptomyces virginiae TaxID=1961 RepID=UPI0036662CA9